MLNWDGKLSKWKYDIPSSLIHWIHLEKQKLSFYYYNDILIARLYRRYRWPVVYLQYCKKTGIQPAVISVILDFTGLSFAFYNMLQPNFAILLILGSSCELYYFELLKFLSIIGPFVRRQRDATWDRFLVMHTKFLIVPFTAHARLRERLHACACHKEFGRIYIYRSHAPALAVSINVSSTCMCYYKM